jgi:DNA-binding CsgD family transcriptional regulator
MNRHSLVRATELSNYFKEASLVLPLLLQISNGNRETKDLLSDLGSSFQREQFRLGELIKRSYVKSLEISNHPIINWITIVNETTFTNLSYTQQSAEFSEKSICGEFSLKKDKFLVIVSENDLTASSISDINSYGLVVGHFQVDKQFYLIVQSQNTPRDPNPNLAEILTHRELEIATLVAIGCSNKQIANRLKISEWTISTHLRRIFIKLNVTSRAAMIYRCASLIQEILLEDKNNRANEK